MNKSAFVEYCSVQLNQVFTITKDGQPDNVLKRHTEGVIRAGEILGALSRTEAAALVEKVHYEVFGESSSQRAERKKSLHELKELSPDEYFDIPAIERRK